MNLWIVGQLLKDKATFLNVKEMLIELAGETHFKKEEASIRISQVSL